MTDGKNNKSLWDKWLNKPRKRNTMHAHPENTDDYVIHDIPMVPLSPTPAGMQISDSTDFDELKKQRQEKIKNKLIACIRAIRNGKEGDDKKLADQLMGEK